MCHNNCVELGRLDASGVGTAFQAVKKLRSMCPDVHDVQFEVDHGIPAWSLCRAILPPHEVIISDKE